MLLADEGIASEPFDLRDLWLAEDALLMLLFLPPPLGPGKMPEPETECPEPPVCSPEISSRVEPAALEDGSDLFLITWSVEIEGSWMYVETCGLL